MEAGIPGQEISSEQVSELAGLGLDYWWYAVRRAHIDVELGRVAARGELRYLDYGCGTGMLTQHFIGAHAPAQSLGIDGTSDALELAAWTEDGLVMSSPDEPHGVGGVDQTVSGIREARHTPSRWTSRRPACRNLTDRSSSA